MSRFTEYQEFDALGLAQLVRDEKITAKELLTEAQTRLAKFNPVLNAVITPMDALAQSLIGKLDAQSPFAGVPFLVKDLMLPFAGFPMSNGSVAMKQYRPSADCEMAARLNASGLITFGKTNTSELGASSLAASAAFGETRNPWDTTYNSGGSSGGSSAAVAARIVPMAYSSDGGGSIRLPASYCGIFGYKPSRGLNKYEDQSRAWGGAVVSHVSTVSVRDSAAYLDLVSGRSNSFSASCPAEHSYLAAATQRPERLRIALITNAPIGTDVHGECIKAAEFAASRCEALGHAVEPAEWCFDGMTLMRAFLTVVFRYTARDVADIATLLKTDARNLEIELNTRFMETVGSGISDNRLSSALSVWNLAAEKLSQFYRHYDVLLTPTVATPPLRSNALDPTAFEKLVMRGLIATGLGRKIFSNSFLDALIHKSLYQTPFTPIANITGQPAMSIPLYWDQNGLPHGSHFMAAEGNDRLLFQLATQLESDSPWKHKRPNPLQPEN